MSELHKDSTTVWVQANPADVPVYSFEIGQLLTVMGEVITKTRSVDMSKRDVATAPMDSLSDDRDVSTTTATDDTDDRQGRAVITSTNVAYDNLPMAWIRART